MGTQSKENEAFQPKTSLKISTTWGPHMVNDLDAYLIIQHKRMVFVNKISVQHLKFNE